MSSKLCEMLGWFGMLVNSFPGSLSTEYRTWDKQMGRWCSKNVVRICGYVRIGPPPVFPAFWCFWKRGLADWNMHSYWKVYWCEHKFRHPFCLLSLNCFFSNRSCSMLEYEAVVASQSPCCDVGSPHRRTSRSVTVFCPWYGLLVPWLAKSDSKISRANLGTTSSVIARMAPMNPCRSDTPLMLGTSWEKSGTLKLW